MAHRESLSGDAQGPHLLSQTGQELNQAECDTVYTTTQKMVQVMRGKGLVKTDDSVHPPLYTAAESREQTQLSMLDDLAQRVFGGSTKKLVMSLLSANRITADELREIQRLLRQSEGGRP